MEPLFQIDDGDEGAPCTLAEMLEANIECLSHEDFAAIGYLAVGASLQLGGGAWAVCTITRVR